MTPSHPAYTPSGSRHVPIQLVLYNVQIIVINETTNLDDDMSTNTPLCYHFMLLSLVVIILQFSLITYWKKVPRLTKFTPGYIVLTKHTLGNHSSSDCLKAYNS